MDGLLRVVGSFRLFWPGVRLRLMSENLGFTAVSIEEGEVDIGIVSEPFEPSPKLDTCPVARVTLVAVAAPVHPLANVAGPVSAGILDEYVQLVLLDRSSRTAGVDYGVKSRGTWRLSDLGVKLNMLRAGLGWGTMPSFMVEDDLATGRLKRLDLVGEDASVRLFAARRSDRALGPAATWLYESMSECGASDAQT